MSREKNGPTCLFYFSAWLKKWLTPGGNVAYATYRNDEQ
jgi:hypothetical protein